MRSPLQDSFNKKIVFTNSIICIVHDDLSLFLLIYHLVMVKGDCLSALFEYAGLKKSNCKAVSCTSPTQSLFNTNYVLLKSASFTMCKYFHEHRAEAVGAQPSPQVPKGTLRPLMNGDGFFVSIVRNTQRYTPTHTLTHCVICNKDE